MDDNPLDRNEHESVESASRASRLPGHRQEAPSWVVRYGLAVVAVVAAMGFQQAVVVSFGSALPLYITFLPVVMIVALLGGFGPGVVATVLASLAAAYWLLPPAGLAVGGPVERLGLVIFAGMGLLMSAVADLYRRNRHKAAAYDRETALRESQARLATFAEATFEGIVESEAGRVVDCNEQFARIVGCAAAELRGVEIASLIAPEDRDRVMASIREGREAVTEQTMLRKDGTRIMVETHGRPESPGSTRRHTAVRDITERKRAEVTLQREHYLLRTLIDLIPDPIYVRDTEDRFLLANAVHARAMGVRSPEEMLGKTDDDYYGARRSAAFRADDQRVLAGETILSKEEVVVFPAGGERVLLTTKVPFKDRDGAVVGLVGVGRDITERKQAQEAVQASRAKLEAALASMTDAVFISDAQGRFIEFNEAFATFHRFKSKADCAKTLAEYPEILEVFLANGERAPLDQWAVPRALRGETVTNAEYTLRRKDTGETWVGSYSFSPIRDKDGVIVGSVVAARDITELKRAETELRQRAEELRAANEELTRFNRVTVGRELRIIELKKQVNELCARLGQPPRFESVLDEEARPTP